MILSVGTVWLLAFALVAPAYANTCSEVAENTSVESTSCAALKPSCIIFPKNAAEVSAIVSVLNGNNESFAINSGGHNPNNYWSSVAGGPLISTQKLDQVLLDPTTGRVRVGPGQRLDSTAAALQGTGWTFVGGCIGNTGVGGLVLGGGLSYMSAQYGWAASSVLEYELVLANGTIRTVTATNYPGLFKSIKGGGNNFGIVVSYLVQAYRKGTIYGGNIVFVRTPEVDAKILQTVRDFTEYNVDDKAAVIVTAERTNVNLVDSWILFLFYDGAVPPAGTFDNFTSIGPILNTARERTYADLMAFSNWVIVPASIVTIATETIPLPSPENLAAVMYDMHAHWRNVSGTTLAVPGIVASIAWQPFPKRIAAAARERSPDLIDAEPDAHKIILEINYSFLLPADYGRMTETMQATYGGIRDRVLAHQEAGRLPPAYLPLFMNYGFFKQDYFARLKPASRALAHKVAGEVDPQGLFRDRTGGWKP
ncbi:hypothetical protein B0T26DRAFT_739276 [Lasiosphaeria miniovina]|uniref:FAD-binding PCMH-type domain-containing protein n=1 Tax=Lasiosphaeria miniovina TaxID=1954250 RepID=A0AA40ATU0_9PEZI|nr:uncharacterized protein B0T26DRAFT_739276 [Lasiosphaeria miniovina]KAK0721903.1 hypothetical protein B0T26DRAFT_739276 [Lasiosphaeria miniovina]